MTFLRGNSRDISVAFHLAAVLPPSSVYGHTSETGKLQLIPLPPKLTRSPTTNGLVPAVGGGGLTVRFQSDVEAQTRTRLAGDGRHRGLGRAWAVVAAVGGMTLRERRERRGRAARPTARRRSIVHELRPGTDPARWPRRSSRMMCGCAAQPDEPRPGAADRQRLRLSAWRRESATPVPLASDRQEGGGTWIPRNRSPAAGLEQPEAHWTMARTEICWIEASAGSAGQGLAVLQRPWLSLRSSRPGRPGACRRFKSSLAAFAEQHAWAWQPGPRPAPAI